MGHIFAQHTILCSDHVAAHIFGRRFCTTIDDGRCPTGKAQKFLFIANCGMRVAMDIGVSCDYVSRFYRYFWHTGYDVWKRMYGQRHGGTIGPLRRSERVP